MIKPGLYDELGKVLLNFQDASKSAKTGMELNLQIGNEINLKCAPKDLLNIRWRMNLYQGDDEKGAMKITSQFTKSWIPSKVFWYFEVF